MVIKRWAKASKIGEVRVSENWGYLILGFGVQGLGPQNGLAPL